MGSGTRSKSRSWTAATPIADGVVDMQWDPRDQRETVNQIIPQHNLHDQSNLYIGRIGKIGAVIQNRKGSDRKRKVQAEQVIW